jgi:hypothetical protein
LRRRRPVETLVAERSGKNELPRRCHIDFIRTTRYADSQTFHSSDAWFFLVFSLFLFIFPFLLADYSSNWK